MGGTRKLEGNVRELGGNVRELEGNENPEQYLIFGKPFLKSFGIGNYADF